MTFNRLSAIVLAVIFLSGASFPVCASSTSTAAFGSAPEQAPGFFEKVMEFFGGLLSTGDTEEGAVENGREEIFSKNPYVYIAAFWTEIVKAPGERTFLERIMAFLQAVRVRRSR